MIELYNGKPWESLKNEAKGTYPGTWEMLRILSRLFEFPIPAVTNDCNLSGLNQQG